MRRRNTALASTVAAVLVAAAGWIFDSAAQGPATNMSSALPATSAEVNDLLSTITVVEAIPHASGYERGCGTDKKTRRRQACVFGPAWNNPQSRSGCDTRNLVLSAQLNDVQYKPGTRNCKVTAGWRVDPYTGTRITLKQIAIDHVVPLSAAWSAGAWQWTQQQRVTFANDTDNLLAVSSTTNSSKSDSTIAEWLPSVGACPYVVQYLTVVRKYHLPVTTADRTAAITTCATDRPELSGGGNAG